MLLPNICAATVVLSTLVAGYPLTSTNDVESQLSVSKRGGPWVSGWASLLPKGKKTVLGVSVEADRLELARQREVLGRKFRTGASDATRYKRPHTEGSTSGPKRPKDDAEPEFSLNKRGKIFFTEGWNSVRPKAKNPQEIQHPVLNGLSPADRAEAERLRKVLADRFGTGSSAATHSKPLTGAEAKARSVEIARLKASLDQTLGRNAAPRQPSTMRPLYGNDAATESAQIERLRQDLAAGAGKTRLEDIPVRKAYKPRPN